MSGALTIGRFRADCEVAAALPGTAFRDCAVRAVRDHGASTLQSALGPWLDGTDASVWIVRSLAVPVVVSADTPSDALASEIVRSMSLTMGRELIGDGDGINTIRFPARHAYVARFVADVAEGDPWRRWYFAPYAGLQVLGRSAAITAALLARPESILDALAIVGERALGAACQLLAPADEARILATIEQAPPGPDHPSAAIACAACEGLARAAAQRVSSGATLFATVAAASRNVTGPSLVQAIRLIQAAVSAAASDDLARRGELLEAVSREASQLSLPDGGDLRHVLSSSLRAAEMELLRRDTARRVTLRAPVRQVAERARQRYTPFGGVFLLLRDLERLPWDAWMAGWPAIDRVSACTVSKWITLALSCGGSRAADFLADEAWREILGIPARLEAADLRSWSHASGRRRKTVLAHEVSAASEPFTLTRSDRAWPRLPGGIVGDGRLTAALRPAACVALRTFAARLPGFGASSPSFIWEQFLSASASIELDDERLVARYGRPPLHLVLTLTGMTRGLVAGTAADDRKIVLFPGE